jgi:gamma-glutamyl-gamma-aminobutyrate hydrolase PuuD
MEAHAGKMSRVVQRYPGVKGRPDLPVTAEEWLERFRQNKRTEPIFGTILRQMARDRMVFDSEGELVTFARVVLDKIQERVRESKRGQEIGRRRISVGIPFRADGRGKAILKDIELVSQGSGYRAVILITADQKRSLSKLVPDRGTAAAIEANSIVIGLANSLTMLGIDGLYISGGPHDHPETTGAGRPRETGSRAAEADERHEVETALLRQAQATNIPVLGVCGGSWRLAHTKGAKIVRLDKEKAAVHAGPMTETHKHRHDVVVERGTMLHGIIGRGNYRTWEKPEADSMTNLGVAVNSVHWATSVFGGPGGAASSGSSSSSSSSGGGMRVSARDSTEVEAFEDPSQHFSVGIQWHPEYAQLGLEGEHGQASGGGEHRNIMAAFGDAARDSHAARMLQSNIRGMLARKRVKALRESGAGTTVSLSSTSAATSSTHRL